MATQAAEHKAADRKSLAVLLGVKPASAENDEVRDFLTAIDVDRKLARMFGARLFATFDWNVFSKPAYSLDQVAAILASAHIDIPAQDFVRETLTVHRLGDCYSFERGAGPNCSEVYTLRYHRKYFES